MRRRRFLAGAGMLVGAGSAALGTGAFTSVESERSVSIVVAKDYYAFLRMEPIGDKGIDGEETGRSFVNGEQIEFEIPGDEDGENPGAAGVGVDSVYEFYDLVSVSNQGTQPVQIYSTYDGNTLADLALIAGDGVLRKDPPVLDVGDDIGLGLYIDTHDSNIGEFEETLTIVADQPDDE
ncbi:hypothetical protein [Haloarchaeobius sp. DT45]|uniref:hypothetical protein n=1 Tax=Haloarchaeobius sp. DT45 TaxID=3446116 RepID=UPI003F6D4A2A